MLLLVTTHLLALTCALAPADGPPTWTGTLGNNRLALELVEGEAPSVTLYVLTQDSIAFPADTVTLADGAFDASFTDLGASVRATVDDSALTLDWRQPGFATIVDLARDDALPGVLERRRVTELGVHPRAPLATAQFAFLVGEWHGTQTRLGPDGAYFESGTIVWKGAWVLDGMAVQNSSQTRGPGGRVVQWGLDTRVYDASAQRWNHRYMDAQRGTFLDLEWTVDEDGVLVSSVVPWMEPGGTMADHVIRIEVLDEDTFRWTADLSTDGGETWVREHQVNVNRRVR